jgi:hypothetical protein
VRFWKRKETLRPEAFFVELASVYPEKYNKMDRYREFRSVFLGSEQGKRVLYEILSWGGMLRPSSRNFDTNETFFHEGERNIALKIMTIMNAEPKQRPTSTKE